MANLDTVTVPNGEGYVDLAELSGITFESGETYRLQSYDNSFYLREGEDGKGDLVKPGIWAYFTASTDDIYVCPILAPATINIAKQ